MPLDPHLSNYADEADFISNFLVPLLRRLGFSIVAEYHGTREFGKDLVFGEVDRFGHITYHGLQAKYVPSVSQSDSHKLVEDCREAFNNPFQHPHTDSEERIASFYVANAGSIAKNARTNFFNALNRPHGGHVRLLDGKALVDLDRWATVNRVDSVRELLFGLRLELLYNKVLLQTFRRVIVAYKIDQKTLLPLERCRTAAVTSYLTKPFLQGIIDVEVIDRYCYVVCGAVNAGLDNIAHPGQPKKDRLRLCDQLCPLIDEALALGIRLFRSTNKVLSQLEPLSGM